MSSLLSLSLGSRFWVKNCSDINLGDTSFEPPTPSSWLLGWHFLGMGSLRQQMPFGSEFLQNSSLERQSCCISQVRKERKEAARYLQSFCDFPKVSEGRLQDQPSSKSCWVVELNFSLSQRQQYQGKQIPQGKQGGWWLWSWAFGKLAGPFYIWRMWLNASWQVLQVISFRLWESFPCKELGLFVF